MNPEYSYIMTMDRAIHILIQSVHERERDSGREGGAKEEEVSEISIQYGVNMNSLPSHMQV